MHFSASILKSKSFGLGLGLQIAFAVFVGLANPAPTAAQLTVCNYNAKVGIMVAVSYTGKVAPTVGGAPTTTSGWIAVAAGECQVGIAGSIHNISDIYVFAWEPSNPSHIWAGDPRDPYGHCVPPAGKDGKMPQFVYHDHEANNPPCGPGQVRVTFLDLEIEKRYSYTKGFKDPEEGEAPEPSNQPPVASAPGKAALTGGSAPSAAPAAVPKPAPAVLSTPNAPTGNAVLSVASGLPVQAGAPNPLAAHTVVLLNQSFEAVLAGAGLQAPAGASLVKGYLAACANNQPACQAGIAATNSSTVSGAKTDASGKAQLPGVPPGTYYFFCLGAYNNQLFKWDFQVQLKAGANSVTLDQHNAAAVN
jgi:uncharacterized membrane protein